MSIDGSGILESDLAHDVYNEILDLYDSGLPITEIRARATCYTESLENDLEREIYLAASAKAYWEIGHLSSDHFTQLARLIESGKSLSLWSQNGNRDLAKARKASLLSLMRRIAAPRVKPRPRRKYSQVKTKLYSLGDCLRLAAEQKVHRGVVCKILEYRGRCEYAILVMGPSAGSTIESYSSGSYYGHVIPSSLDQRGYVFGPHVMLLEHRMLLRAGNPFQVLGRIDLDETAYSLGSFGGILDVNGILEDFDRTETNPQLFGLKLLPLQQLIRVPTKSPI